MNLKPINPYYRKTETYGYYSLRDETYPYQWIRPVTDRTESDVVYAQTILNKSWEELTTEEQKAYIGGLKGCMNRSDFERIENDMQILLDVLEIAADTYVGAVPNIPTQSYFNHMEQNITAIRAAYNVHTDTPPVPEQPYNTWEKYNAIEQILADVYEMVTAQIKYFAGELYCGDTVGLLL